MKVWKNKKGVSPVIATILMVAITVVLAAVLYVMVMGMIGSQPQTVKAVALTANTYAGIRVTVQVQQITGGDVVLSKIYPRIVNKDGSFDTTTTVIYLNTSVPTPPITNPIASGTANTWPKPTLTGLLNTTHYFQFNYNANMLEFQLFDDTGQIGTARIS